MPMSAPTNSRLRRDGAPAGGLKLSAGSFRSEVVSRSSVGVFTFSRYVCARKGRLLVGAERTNTRDVDVSPVKNAAHLSTSAEATCP